MVKAVVLDIEGTVCPISFVKDVLFPFAVAKIHELVGQLPASDFPLSSVSSNELVSQYLAKFPAEYVGSASALLDHIDDLVKNDVKAPYLKTLQGYLWKSGYESGEIKAPLYSDALAMIPKWASELENGVYIYSSGSVAAQILLFAHCNDIAGSSNESHDLTSVLDGYFDTVNAGQKVDSKSYDAISDAIKVDGADILFFTDNPKEIDAAMSAGWNTAIVVRPGNAPFDEVYNHKTTVVTDFSMVDLSLDGENNLK